MIIFKMTNMGRIMKNKGALIIKYLFQMSAQLNGHLFFSIINSSFLLVIAILLIQINSKLYFAQVFQKNILRKKKLVFSKKIFLSPPTGGFRGLSNNQSPVPLLFQEFVSIRI